MPLSQLTELLDENGVKYTKIWHSRAFTAQEVAASAHVKGKDLAKTVIVKLDGKMAMAVLPASFSLDLSLLREAAGGANVALAAEAEFRDLFPGCETGAMPPFGSLYGMDVFVDTHLVYDEQIAFNAGTHTELVQLDYKDFERLAKPKVAKLVAR
ncbi:MAG: YbaK/EbsC family protein [Bryobacterales bacterium]|nr:YbaK/EbsC family protein [Bryobacterales bacterium]